MKASLWASWNDKNLDYEIETECLHSDFLREYHLKRQEPRLRDWNDSVANARGMILETWNDKNLDYEIETCQTPFHHHPQDDSWNDKNLDYEIETSHRSALSRRAVWLETTRTSITRLKHTSSLFWLKWIAFTTWNDKNLDYEIETVVIRHLNDFHRALKRQEPRLRDWNMFNLTWFCVGCAFLKRQEPRLRDWNFAKAVQFVFAPNAWNDKNLDYEIETLHKTLRSIRGVSLETTRTSITRLKRLEKGHEPCGDTQPWNDKNLDYEIETENALDLLDFLGTLETTRTSITRLKLEIYRDPPCFVGLTWNDKNLDYEIET